MRAVLEVPSIPCLDRDAAKKECFSFFWRVCVCVCVFYLVGVLLIYQSYELPEIDGIMYTYNNI